MFGLTCPLQADLFYPIASPEINLFQLFPWPGLTRFLTRLTRASKLVPVPG